MTPLTRFEDIQAWQEARKLVQLIYNLTSQGLIAKDYSLRDVVSVMANIAEGFDCESKAEFARFLGIARRSAVEVQSLLYIGLDVGYLDEETFRACYDQATKTKALIGGFKHALQKKP